LQAFGDYVLVSVFGSVLRPCWSEIKDPYRLVIVLLNGDRFLCRSAHAMSRAPLLLIFHGLRATGAVAHTLFIFDKYTLIAAE
jgi:hypothetical protein